jgi:hypothetical protein
MNTTELAQSITTLLLAAGIARRPAPAPFGRYIVLGDKVHETLDVEGIEALNAALAEHGFEVSDCRYNTETPGLPCNDAARPFGAFWLEATGRINGCYVGGIGHMPTP